jgi:ubiquinone/menaquinone biosynthesis C-methylase UbiE
MKVNRMNHNDHVNLIKDGIPSGGIWADLGSGRGAFTLALAECIGVDSHIYSVDINQRELKLQETRMSAEFPQNTVQYQVGDFTHPLDLPALDGIIMANSLHFVHDKLPVLEAIRAYLKPTGRLIVVEYDTAEGNYAVPYPMTYTMWLDLSHKAGFRETTLLATRPSRFLGQFFSSVSYA